MNSGQGNMGQGNMGQGNSDKKICAWDEQLSLIHGPDSSGNLSAVSTVAQNAVPRFIDFHQYLDRHKLLEQAERSLPEGTGVPKKSASQIGGKTCYTAADVLRIEL